MKSEPVLKCSKCGQPNAALEHTIKDERLIAKIDTAADEDAPRRSQTFQALVPNLKGVPHVFRLIEERKTFLPFWKRKVAVPICSDCALKLLMQSKSIDFD
jgi:hypothetical protein